MSSVTKRAEYWEILNCLHEHNINPVTREIYIGGWPSSCEDEEVGVDHQMACEVIRNITFLQNQSDEPILIHQCTIGGEWEYGMAIFNAIQNCPCYVTVLGYAHARSMSSIMIQGADKRVLMPDCLFMVHHGSMYISDTHKGAMTHAKQAEFDAKRMMEVYIQRGCKVGEREIERRLDSKQEWYLTPYEAVELGFADEVFDGDWDQLRVYE